MALAADRIVAHPGTITGSVGVIFMVPKVGGLMDKLGLAVDVNKSGKEKDIGTPFRPSTPEEKKILQDLTDRMGKRFLDLVARHRKLDQKSMNDVAHRPYLPFRPGFADRVDRQGGLCKRRDFRGQGRLPAWQKNARVVAYRRTKYPNDNVYNPGSSYGGGQMSPSRSQPVRDRACHETRLLLPLDPRHRKQLKVPMARQLQASCKGKKLTRTFSCANINMKSVRASRRGPASVTGPGRSRA